MKTVKNLMVVLAGVLALSAAAATYNGVVYSETGPIVPGEWTSQFTAAKAYAEANDIPLIAFWGNKGCPHCDYTEKAMTNSAEFAEWMARRQCVMSYNIGQVTEDKEQKAAFSFLSSAGSSFPFMGVYWKGHTLTGLRAGKDKACFTAPDKSANWIMAKVDSYLTDYEPAVNSTFGFEESDFNRYEAEASTRTVAVSLVRKRGSRDLEEQFVVLAPDGRTTSQIESVTWAVGETNKTVEVAIAEGAFSKVGEQLTLRILSSDGRTVAETHVTYVEPANSSSNPDWIGAQPEFGRWTADYDEALTFAEENGGYVLACVQGSLWCPDCANVERNFLDLADENGENRFRAWAATNRVVPVAVDIPNYNGSGEKGYATPTLFSRDAYETALARANEWPASGADAALTNKVPRSGLGYLTRKMVSDEEAEKKRQFCHKLASTNTDADGLHRPEDTNAYRTGVPMFALLKGRRVVARFTSFASISPMAADQANFERYCRRLGEMIALAEADETEIANNWPSLEAGLAMAANGGSLASTIGCVDLQDAVRLDGLSGSAEQTLTVRGDADASVTVQLYRLADGQVTPVSNAYRGKLSNGVTFTASLSGSGAYFALVKGEAGDAAFAPAAEGSGVVNYELSGSTVYVPDEAAAAGVADADGKACVRLVQGELYRFEGIDATACADVLAATDGAEPHRYFRALSSGDVALTVADGAGATFSCQLWHPGEVGFVEPTKTVAEGVNRDGGCLEVPVARTGGSSGYVRARVAVDAAATTLTNAFGQARYELPDGEAREFRWEDGVATNMAFRVRVLDDNDYDGDGVIALRLELLDSELDWAAVAAGRGDCRLTVAEDDRAEPGRAMVTRAAPHWAKAGTVYVRAGEGAEVWVKRIEASDGPVGVELKSSLAGVAFAAEAPSDLEEVSDAKTRKTKTLLRWANRDMAEKRLVVTGVPAGKTAKVTLAAYGGFGVVSASNAVTVAAVADDAPGFEPASMAATVYRYVACSNLCPVVSSAGGKLTFAKVSGSLPSGLSVAHDAAAGAMAVFGVPTASPGAAGTKRYEAVYQVTEARPTGVGTRTAKVPGLTVRLVFDLVDPAVAGGAGGAALNGFYAKARTYADVPVVDAAAGALAGVLQLTVPPTGRASAKFLCALGTVSFSAKGFSSVGADGAFRLVLASATKACPDAELKVLAGADGGLEVAVAGLGAEMRATAAAPAWSAAHPAERFRGQYTVAMPVRSAEVAEGVAGLAPRGTPHLTLKMTTKAEWNVGRVKWAGALANGTAVSGTAVLSEETAGGAAVAAHLPVAKQSKTDFFSALLRIAPDALEQAGAAADDTCYQTVTAPTLELDDGSGAVAEVPVRPYWYHTENAKAVPDAGFSVRYDLYGAIFDLSHDLDCCCEDYVGTTSLQLAVKMPTASDYYGELTPVTAPSVTVEAKTVKVNASSPNPQQLTLKLASTGVVTGTFKVPYVDATGREKQLSATYKGVILIGWSSACGCSDVNLPFIHGAWTFDDQLAYESVSGTKVTTKYLKVKRGDVIETLVP
ncbi:MAG: hypothetical protein ACI4RD_02255 [Kiritimatiellia bacterium]